MRPLTAADLLAAWEVSLAQPPLERALTLLAAGGDASRDEIARWSIGRRDAALLNLREHLFGSRVESVESCPQCGERLELSFDVAQIRAAFWENADELLCVHFNDYSAEFRVPNTLDLMSLGNEEDAPHLLLQRCICSAWRKGEAVEMRELPSEAAQLISQRMAEADPQGNVQLELCCPACGHRWGATFDIAGFLWSELNAWARRTLNEVHVLARAYGWREADILGMSARRRQLYLEMVGA